MTAKQSAQDRLPALIDAAIVVFARRGYRAAQMVDIAREMGVSEAALYRYVESKEGLFGLALRHALGLEDAVAGQLPVRSPPLDVTVKEIGAQIALGSRPARLEEALGRRGVAEPAAELEAIVRELFALTVRRRDAIDMIEQSARELSELAEVFDAELRRPLVQAVTAYLERRMRQGHLRGTPDPWATARVVVEMVRYFARHRSFDEEGASLPSTAAEDAVVDVLVHALLPEPPSDR